MSYKEITQLLGQTLVSVVASEYEIIFETVTGDRYKMYHEQCCCEDVQVEDIVGDLTDLLQSPILRAEERSNQGTEEEYPYGSCTWTFYELSTIKGSVTIRWFGSSNGYYSEEVSFVRI